MRARPSAWMGLAAVAALLIGLAVANRRDADTEPRATVTANKDLRPSPATPRIVRPTATPAPTATPDVTRARGERRPRARRSQAGNAPPRSRSIGSPTAGRLSHGVALPVTGPDHVTWHPIRKSRPNARWRRHGTDRLVRLVLRVARQHRRANHGAPRLLVGDLSRPRGGDFGARISGGIGHASHQNGLDVDIYYPRNDRRLRAPRNVAQVDRRLAQDLVDRFAAAGARFVFTGPSLGLRGPRRIVQPLPHHDNHLHVRLPG